MNDRTNLIRALLERCPGLSLEQNAPLAGYTSFAIGGPAAVLAQPKSAGELAACLALCAQAGEEPVVLGSGTNVLVPDEGLDRVVIRTRGLDQVALTQEGLIRADCGLSLARLAKFAWDQGLTGLEFAQGIPGSVGGGVLMNAGAYDGELSQVCVRTRVLLPEGTEAVYEGQDQGFGYRMSAFQNLGGVILGSEFRLVPGDRQAIRARMEELSVRRRASQPLELPSAGSTFKRPKTGYAAAMIDQAGCKGLRVGGAGVSEKHAGFVVNLGGATAKDVRELMTQVQRRVYDRFGVELEPEVRLL